MPKFPRRRVAGTALAMVGALAAATAFAHGSGPVKGAKYSGAVKDAATPTTLSFKVSKDGKEVTKVVPSPDFPTECAAFSGKKYVSKPAKIKSKSFEVTVKFKTDTGSKLPAGTVKGKFASKGKESGTMTPIKALGSSCVKTYSYKTKAK